MEINVEEARILVEAWMGHLIDFANSHGNRNGLDRIRVLDEWERCSPRIKELHNFAFVENSDR